MHEQMTFPSKLSYTQVYPFNNGQNSHPFETFPQHLSRFSALKAISTSTEVAAQLVLGHDRRSSSSSSRSRATRGLPLGRGYGKSDDKTRGVVLTAKLFRFRQATSLPLGNDCVSEVAPLPSPTPEVRYSELVTSSKLPAVDPSSVPPLVTTTLALPSPKIQLRGSPAQVHDKGSGQSSIEINILHEIQ